MGARRVTPLTLPRRRVAPADVVPERDRQADGESVDARPARSGKGPPRRMRHMWHRGEREGNKAENDERAGDDGHAPDPAGAAEIDRRRAPDDEQGNDPTRRPA